MIVPSIDIMDGLAVQLVQGKTKVLEAGDPRPLAERFGRVGEVAVVDLDAALGKGSNAAVIRDLLPLAKCRVGGGIRSVEAATEWLDAGAAKVVLGTAATPEVLSALPKSRVIAALDAWEGDVVVKGWTEKTGRSVAQAMAELEGLVDGFLVTFVEGEGMEGGFPRDRVKELVALARGARVTVAGGVTKAEEVGWLDRQGADAQVGMALYKGTLGLADAFCGPLESDREDGLWPTVVADEDGRVLGLVWSSRDSVTAALDEGRGIYHSRSRGLWRKGESSGSVQQLLSVSMDCDRDALLFRVRQQGSGFCHEGTWDCFDTSSGFGALERTIQARSLEPDGASLTSRLLREPEFLEAKILEEAQEVVDAADSGRVVEEAADVMYFLSVLLAREGKSLSDVASELDRRSLKVTRRQPSPAGGSK
ncbi:MAG: phosphoribosyl-ATP diphosphatase [Longimicrobiales bacterium]